jgi:hypothetical protein
MAAPCSQWIARSPVQKRIAAGRSTGSLDVIKAPPGALSVGQSNKAMTPGLKVAFAAFVLFMVTLPLTGPIATIFGFAFGIVGIGGIIAHNIESGRRANRASDDV